MAGNSKIEWTTHKFNPWRMRNNLRIVAAESYWREPLKWNKSAACSCGGNYDGGHQHDCPQANRPRVFCASLADVFEDWQGPMVDSQGRTLQESPVGFDDMLYTKARPLTMQDVRRRLFALIDATPNLDWLLLTKHPENIAGMWPSADLFEGHVGDDKPAYWPNVWLGMDEWPADLRVREFPATNGA